MDHKLKLRSSALSLAAVFTLAACGSPAAAHLRPCRPGRSR